MSKEYLEALERIIEGAVYDNIYTKQDLEQDVNTVKQGLLELKAIKEANPSEALDCLENMYTSSEDTIYQFEKEYKVIKQYILKAQEMEKENAYIEKVKTMMKQKECVLRYVESEDCFAVKTILSDGWYKLTPEFVENNVREEIKLLPLIEKNRQLREENAELKRVLEIIKEKCLHTDNLRYVSVCINYDMYKEKISNLHDTAVVKIDWTCKDVLDCLKILTQEEFDLLKRYFEKNIQK